MAMEFEVPPQSHGDFIVTRNGIGGTAALKYLDPFVSFSDFSMSHHAGFDDHPHRGFDSIMYVLEGAVDYRDTKGHHATINSGDIQWVKTGRGTIHSEKAAGEGVTRAIQLWINVPSSNKMDYPECMEIPSNNIKERRYEAYTVKTMADHLPHPITFSDYVLDPMAHLSWNLPQGWNGFAYVLEGRGTFGPTSCGFNNPSKPNTLVVMPSSPTTFGVYNDDRKSRLRFLLVAGRPINEPIVQHGPFVMNTKDEIDQTIQDYRCRSNGFD
ncbi:PREDICTED: pirin-like protein 2 isoform X1 [Tarenaya hassleriana]|uniref:pirin-like protein 2 isoform X1 n=1 Tax=Tarenaya hassleriana TaxID=28532 RepID=UPI00053C7755|nr:PREDICTED: pirin-like protein 2 isoform X1 [Tarenaya hassleriana]